MTGGADNDTFVFDTAPNAVDTVTDFNASGSATDGDLVELSLATFTDTHDGERQPVVVWRVRCRPTAVVPATRSVPAST